MSHPNPQYDPANSYRNDPYDVLNMVSLENDALLKEKVHGELV